MLAQLLEDGEAFSEATTVGRVNVTVENRDTARLCSMIAQPMVVTFDGMEYMSLGKAEYLVYENIGMGLPEKVNVRFQSCGGALTSCPCGVMVQSGDDVYVLDSCRRIGQDDQPLTFRVYRNGEYTPYTHVYYDTDGQATQFVLPSGSIVFVRSVEQKELDVWIHPSGLAWNNTRGLCGTFDGDVNNDFTYPDLSVEAVSDVRQWRGSLLPFDFLKTWKQDNTLMYGVAENSGYKTRNNTLCQCTGASDGLCEPVDLVETCDFVSGVDYTDLLSVFEVDTDQSGPARRRKRQAVGEFDESEVTFDELPQTPQSISEENARQVCQDSITSAGFWDVCSDIVDTTNIITSCVNSVLLNDNYDAVGTTLDNLRVTCQLAILADPGLSTFLNMTYETLVPYVLNVTCDNNCNENGQCESGVCVCEPGYKGDDCSLLQANAPTLVSLSENLLTSVSASGNLAVTRSVEIYGNSFTNTDSLLCHTQQVEITSAGYTPTGATSTQSATFKTVGTVQCELTGSLPLSAVLVTVSNDGQNQSNGLLFIVQDEVCYDCEPASGVCNIQPTSCVIDGACYEAADRNPADPCYICDPITNLWKYKPSATCTEDDTTTTSTTTRSTSPTTTTTQNTTTTTSGSTSPSSPTPSPTPTPSTSSPNTSTSSPSPTPSTTQSSSSPSSSSSSPTTPTPTAGPTSSQRPTTTNSEGGSEGQGGSDDDDDRTTLIIVISVAGIVVMVVFATVICIACRLKRNDQRRMEESTISSSRTPSTQLVKAKRGDSQLQGRLNPYFQDVEFATAHGQDQPAVARRAAPTRAAPFNPQGLSDTRGYGPRPEPGSGEMYEINIGMFEGSRGPPGAGVQGGGGGRVPQGASKHQPTHTWEEVGYKIPRPDVEAVYDTSAGRASPEKVRKSERASSPQLEGMYTHL